MNASIKISAPASFGSGYRQKIRDEFGDKPLKLLAMHFNGSTLKRVVVSKYDGHRMEVESNDLNFSISFE
jgi:hypothetical protein